MGLMDKVKGMLKGREKQLKSGIDTVSNQVEKRVGTKYAGKVDDLSDKAKGAVDKLAGADEPDPPSAATPAAAPSTPAPATPPAAAPATPPAAPAPSADAPDTPPT